MMCRLITYLSILLFLILLPFRDFSQIVIVDSVCQKIEHFEWLVDSSGTQPTLAIANQSGYFKPSTSSIITLGSTSAALWIKLNITNRSRFTNWYLQIKQPPVFHEIGWYERRGNEIIVLSEFLGDQPDQRRIIQSDKLLLPINLKSEGQSEYYLKLTSNNILRSKLQLVTLETVYEQNSIIDWANGIAWGVLLAFGIYNLFVFYKTKEFPYLYYLFYILAWGINLIFYNGYLTYLFPSLAFISNAGIIIPIAALLSLIFTASFLKLKQNNYILYNGIKVLVVVSCLPITITLLNGGHYAFFCIQYLMYFFFSYLMICGFVCLRNGYKPAIYYILGIGSFIIGNSVQNLMDLQLLPENIVTQTGMYWGAVSEAIILSYALAFRLNYYRGEQEFIQQHLISEKKKFLMALIDEQEKEKKRIAMELHDSIGQKLVLIKNKCWQLQNKDNDNSLKHFTESTANIITQVRDLTYQLRPYQLELIGITQSLKSLVETSFPCNTVCFTRLDNIDSMLQPVEEMNIYRLLQLICELLNKATITGDVSITLKNTTHTISIELITNSGMLNIYPEEITERIELMNGSLTIHQKQHTVITILLYPGR
ncbi:hypothetical protein DVR12_03925 [Chitinophaga silvatica]|uniref:histidine kinase n=1 Tax=Chitinophaga silvatica TaxID=2282649 RepID=A0A3E1YHP3_9BACT|nr:7TM diverse intracellular signaling domain-containing protein [Chitinophaga silvatica]RFS26943.1 hypothetical protein DVR12_03925 [Chitinophaga silvatica]